MLTTMQQTFVGAAAACPICGDNIYVAHKQVSLKVLSHEFRKAVTSI